MTAARRTAAAAAVAELHRPRRRRGRPPLPQRREARDAWRELAELTGVPGAPAPRDAWAALVAHEPQLAELLGRLAGELRRDLPSGSPQPHRAYRLTCDGVGVVRAVVARDELPARSAPSYHGVRRALRAMVTLAERRNRARAARIVALIVMLVEWSTPLGRLSLDRAPAWRLPDNVAGPRRLAMLAKVIANLTR